MMEAQTALSKAALEQIAVGDDSTDTFKLVGLFSLLTDKRGALPSIDYVLRSRAERSCQPQLYKAAAATPANEVEKDVVSALINLGSRRKTAEAAVNSAV